MGVGIPCLGYPSRTAAVIALRAEGLSTRQIAERIGIEVKTVGALEGSFARKDREKNHPAIRQYDQSGFPVRIDADTWAKLRVAAARRGILPDLLAQQLLMLAVDDGLIDAILDDEDEPMGAAA